MLCCGFKSKKQQKEEENDELQQTTEPLQPRKSEDVDLTVGEAGDTEVPDLSVSSPAGSVFDAESLKPDSEAPPSAAARAPGLPRWWSQEEDEPPVPAVLGRDELALRRHRFFSADSAPLNTHHVRFDPRGPTVLLPDLARMGSQSLTQFDEILAGPFSTYMRTSAQIGGDVSTHASLVDQAFKAQRAYLALASTSRAPTASEQQDLLKPTSEKISAIQDFREKNRPSPFFNHLSAISESIPALGWVAVSPTPAPYVKEMNDAGQFYTNRVLKDWKEKNKVHVDWVHAWVQTLTELQKFVKQHHTTGLIWSGKDAPKAGSAGGAPPPPPPGCPPPPPVLPPIGDLSMEGSGELARSALFAEINQGENITRSLKKVTSDMQTHKNPSLREGPAPFKAQNNIGASPGAKAAPVAKPPSMFKDGKKWTIEYQKGRKDLLIDQVEMSNVVYMFRCEDSVLTVKGKLNSVVLDSCRKTALVFDSVVSSIEFVNCQSVQMQVLGTVPTVSIDKTDGCQMFLNKDSQNVEIVSSKSSEMNVMLPDASGDFMEYPIPEQFKTTLNTDRKGITTTPVESLG